jgi:hypothetical protein
MAGKKVRFSPILSYDGKKIMRAQTPYYRPKSILKKKTMKIYSGFVRNNKKTLKNY